MSSAQMLTATAFPFGSQMLTSAYPQFYLLESRAMYLPVGALLGGLSGAEVQKWSLAPEKISLYASQ